MERRMTEIVLDENPAPEGREQILRPLVEFNLAHAGEFKYGNVAFYLKQPGQDAAVGGLWGRFAAGWLFVELLFVPEELRGQGLGAQLMQQAEALARKHDSIGVWLDSFSFQAPGFYKKLGYSCFGTLADFPKGETRYFFSKRF